MNIKTPLAAALLMTASAAVAQLLPAPAQGSPSSGITLAGMTDPAGPFGGAQFLGNSPDVAWADPGCTHVPCAVKDDKSGKPSWDQAALDKAIAEQKALTPNMPVVDMGDGTYALDLGDGTVSIGTAFSCGIPRKMTDAQKAKFAAQADKDKAKKDADEQIAKSVNGDGSKSINNGKGAINGDGGAPGGGKASPGGPGAFSLTSNGSGAPGAGDGADTPPENPAANSGGRQDGETLAGMQASMDGGTPSSFSSGSAFASASGGGQGEVAAAGKQAVIKVNGNEAVRSFAGYTWRKNADAEANAKRGAEAVKAAFTEGSGSGRVTVDSTIGDGEYLGKTQAVSNGPAK
ncbi:MAG: hypothetical protein PHS14_11585 [Elusimicrobia bacterium]|nr:hypothetical protein [Elusimicrobiota bacterium]